MAICDIQKSAAGCRGADSKIRVPMANLLIHTIQSIVLMHQINIMQAEAVQ